MPINSFYPSTLSFLLTQLLGERQTSKIKPVNKEGNPLCFLSKGKKKTLSKDDEETTAKVTMTKRKGNNNQRQG